MGALFALTTCVLLLLYAAWSAWFVVSTIRSDLRGFIEHELEELALNIRDTDRSTASLRRCVRNIVAVSESPAVAFRVRGADQGIVCEDGPPRLLAAVPEPVSPRDSWREHLFQDAVAVGALDMEGEGLRLEILVDASRHVGAVRQFVGAAALAFAVAASLALAAGRWMAHRGLRGLREVVAQARDIDLATEGATIRVADAPEEVREVGEALNAMLARIQQGLATMRTFTAGLAHELRSPLQNLIGEVEVALLQARSVEDYQRTLSGNLDDLYEISDAVDNLVAFCRSATPEPPRLAVESFDLAEEAGLRLARERRTADRLGLRLELAESGDTTLVADREAGLRVLRNLVGNALQWAPRGSAVRVEVAGDAAGVRLTVEDGGPGVPEALAPRIFEPFVSGRPRAGTRGGYGLGLTICRQVMEAHGGTLRMERGGDGRTRFHAVFPRSGGASVAAGDAAASAPGPGRGPVPAAAGPLPGSAAKR
jgi:signal transduction histidine kinase